VKDGILRSFCVPLAISLSVVGSFALGVQVAIAGLEEDAEWIGEGVKFGGNWTLDPATNDWVDRPVGLPNSPIGYRYDVVCRVADNIDVGCMASKRSCNEAKGGRLVQWYAGLKTEDPATWDPAGESCIYSEEPVDVMDEIAGIIVREFQRRPVEAGVLTVQPSPHTLIRAHTNFYVKSREQVFDFELLGQDVRIVATPTEYTWHYGDGTSHGPVSDPGAPINAESWGEQTATSHAYQETGDYSVSVTVHYSGEYSVNGGQLIPIDGRGEFITGEQTISVWRSETRNVADDCNENPASWGC
jgi:hypothetical protein